MIQFSNSFSKCNSLFFLPSGQEYKTSFRRSPEIESVFQMCFSESGKCHLPDVNGMSIWQGEDALSSRLPAIKIYKNHKTVEIQVSQFDFFYRVKLRKAS